jgi:hypothetical protein
MSRQAIRGDALAADAAGTESATKSRRGSRSRRPWSVGLVGLLLALGAFPATAQAHGPVAPVASAYLAKIHQVPTGIDAKVVDGDLRMWMRVPTKETVVVIDYRGAPYLRFSSSGVWVNENSSMYYLNQTPVAETPPTNLTASTPPTWHHVSGGHSYEWHDGRLHALAAVALAPGAAYVGRWNLPLRVDGRLASIDGGLWHADDPSLVWFWPIIVLIACVLAAWRVRRPRLDALVARVLANVALVGITIAGLGVELHGRPTITVLQLVELALILAFVGWGATRATLRQPGYFTCFLIGVAAVWAGGVLITTLVYGYVLIPLPAFLARTVTVLNLGAGAALLLLVFRLADLSDRRASRSQTPDALDREPSGVSESVA